ncbi:hypothetical protein Tcan_13984 [Toxocara canis]|uniref:Uncharacterized protein n=1 Tax=Toxocara canis TaxID=6265 RepID=A0A0B2VYG8_TOXCA|nr:hypothetical protein Tcan_13984 [Toxocara canis]
MHRRAPARHNATFAFTARRRPQIHNCRLLQPPIRIRTMRFGQQRRHTLVDASAAALSPSDARALRRRHSAKKAAPSKGRSALHRGRRHIGRYRATAVRVLRNGR